MRPSTTVADLQELRHDLQYIYAGMMRHGEAPNCTEEKLSKALTTLDDFLGVDGSRFTFILKLCQEAYRIARREAANPRLHRRPDAFLTRRRYRPTSKYLALVTQKFETVLYGGLSTAESRMILGAWDSALQHDQEEEDRIDEQRRNGIQWEALCPST